MTEPKTPDKSPAPHIHKWYRPAFGVTIDTLPATSTYYCRTCPAATHDPETGVECTIGHFDRPEVPSDV